MIFKQSFRKIGNSTSLLLLLFLVVLLGSLKFSFPQNNILSYDYFGLYLYLPATFIYHDPAISDLSWLQAINDTYGNTPMFYQLQPHDDYNIIRFFCGMAILLAPFFLLGHGFALVSGYAADGFSMPYQYAMMLAAFFYVVVGLVYTRKILLQFFDERTTFFSLLALYLGSNLFFWTTFDAGAPHTILFGLYAMLLWYTHRWHTTPRKRYAIAVGLLLGLIIVSRPSEIIAMFIPLLWGIDGISGLKQKFRLIASNWPHLLLLVLATILMGLPQIAYYYHYTGQLYFSTYTDPQSGLDFSQPRFAWVLFSYRKGWLVYAPIMVFAIAGFVFLWKKKSSLFVALLTHFLLNLFLLASFTSLVSYGWRAFIQSYALLALPLAALIAVIVQQRNKLLKATALILLAALMLLTIFQSWQIMMGIIHGSRMTKEYYWKVFGKTSVDEAEKQLLLLDRYMDDHNGHQLPGHIQYTEKLLEQFDFENMPENHQTFVVTDPLNPSNKVYSLSTAMPYSPGVKVADRDISRSEHYWASIRFKVYSEEALEKGELLLVVTYTYQGSKENLKGKVYKYRTFSIDDNPEARWKEYSFNYLAPEATTANDRLETYLWLRTDKLILLDDFEVMIQEPIP